MNERTRDMENVKRIKYQNISEIENAHRGARVRVHKHT